MLSSSIVFLVAVGTLSTAQLIPNKDNSNNGFTTPTTLPLQVDVNLLYFSNPQGIVYSGKKCDFFPWGCDIKAWGYTDLQKPYEEWPGQRNFMDSDYFWYQGENSSPTFNKTWTLTICDPKSFTAGNLRVHLLDIDGGLRGADDFINNFNCIFTKPSPISGKWTNEIACDAQYA